MQQKIIIIVMQLNKFQFVGTVNIIPHKLLINNQFLGTKENNNIIDTNYQYNISNIKHAIYLLGYYVIIWICAFTTLPRSFTTWIVITEEMKCCKLRRDWVWPMCKSYKIDQYYGK